MNRTEKNKKTAKVEAKFFGSTKFVYLIIFLLLVGMVILYSSDTFKSLPTSTKIQTHNTNNPHASADLSSLNEIKKLENILISNPNDHQATLKLGHLYNDSGFKQKAIEKYTNYLKVHPNEPDVIVDMGVCYFELKKYEKAIELMNKAISIDPKHQIAHFNLGIVNFSAGNIESANEAWARTVEINPSTDVAKRANELSKSH